MCDDGWKYKGDAGSRKKKVERMGQKRNAYVDAINWGDPNLIQLSTTLRDYKDSAMQDLLLFLSSFLFLFTLKR